ncbi:bis(5'-nucleosyl)-tetraphosphatase (symmetrical) YqeK [Haloimpatiens sp. FM7315]|uniref:bis(5'-nucleosyl)-tetraphosphatase (symmetrical) YqeK n=1 Tax=Haloimpatiens sp. FM7315 TaxID=3298609 RepID=UPI00370CBC92
MWNEDTMIGYLKDNLKEERFIHSIGVRDVAQKLASVYDESIMNKARIAGLIHDCAKNLSDEKLLDLVKKEKFKLDEVTKNNLQLLHGFAGAIIAKNIMKVEDLDILNAIKCHTTGKENMSILEKIIYLSDFIEPSREFHGVDSIRELAFENLDEAVIKAFDSTINYVIAKKGLLHKDTIFARNYMILKKFKRWDSDDKE